VTLQDLFRHSISKKRASHRVGEWGLLALAAATTVVGAAVLVFVYHAAQSAPPRYDLFWAGMACIFVPLWIVTMAWFSEPLALAGIVLIGLASYLPAFLRAPDRPVFGDALAHYLSVENTLRTGNLFKPNPIVPVAAYYPGLHALTAALVKVLGPHIWSVVVVLVPLLHVSSLLGIYSIVLALSGNSRASAVAAIIYGISPQFQFFDSQFAYESLAVPFLIWSLALLLQAQCSDDRRCARALLSASAFLGASCVVTHHVTSYVLAGTLILIGLSQFVMGERRSALSSLGVGALVSLFAIGWVLLTNAPVVAYLDYFPRTAFNAVGPIFDKLLDRTTTVAGPPTATATGTATRTLFAGSTLPMYEHYAAFAVQVLAFGATAVAAWRTRSRRSGAMFALALLAATYFLLLPLRLNLAGEQGAGRVATYQWIGIAAVIGVGLVGEPWPKSVRYRARKGQHMGRNVLFRPLSLVLAAVVLLGGLVGNYGASVDAGFQFPGAFQLGSSDGRDTPLEAVKLAERFLATDGPGRTVVSDAATERIFETYAYTRPASGNLPEWEFFLAVYYSSAELQQLAYDNHVNAIVIDDRVIEDSESLGFPPNFETPITTVDLARLASFKWVRVAFRTTHYEVLTVLRTAHP
jgi:hypothetical protein